MAYRKSARAEMFRRMQDITKNREQRWDLDRLEASASEAQSDIDEGASTGGLLGGAAGFGAAELSKWLITKGVSTFLAPATGGLSLLAEPLIWGASNLLHPAMTAMGAKWGTEKGTEDLGDDLGDSRYGTNVQAYEDVEKHFGDYKKGLALQNQIQGLMYGGMLNTGASKAKDLFTKKDLVMPTFGKGVGSQVRPKLTMPIGQQSFEQSYQNLLSRVLGASQ
jgi:hypothetical protein